MILGYLLALAAAIASGTGSVLESIGIRRAGVAGGSLSELASLRHQPVYFLGLTSDLTGFVCSSLALQLLPLFLVQSTLALSVAVTAVISHFLGSHLRGPGWIAVGTGAAGLLLLALSARPGPADPVPTGWHFLLLGMGAVVLALAGWTHGLRDALAAPLLALAAALGFSVVGVSARALQAPDHWWQLIGEPAIWAIVVNGAAGVVVFAMALQKGTALTVSAIMFTTTTTLPSIIGLAYLGDRLRDGFVPLAVTGFVLAVGGAVGTAHFAANASATGDRAPNSSPGPGPAIGEPGFGRR